MKKTLLIAAGLLITVLSANGQTPKMVLKTRTIISERQIMLNGGANASLGGKSRTSIKVDLPLGTKEWYYSFTTRPGPSGTALLNLALQLGSASIKSLAVTGISTSDIKIPDGTGIIDALVLDADNNNLFLNKVDLAGGSYFMLPEGKVDNTKQAVVKIDDVTSGTWYLGLRNPSNLGGVYIRLEVVALVEEQKTVTPDQEKAKLYGNVASKSFQKGDIENAIELNKKALTLDPELGWAWGNAGLFQLAQNDYPSAIESYANAIHYSKNDPAYSTYLHNMIQDLNQLMKKQGAVEGAKEIKEALQKEKSQQLENSLKKLLDAAVRSN
jgi:hypothetical protein